MSSLFNKYNTLVSLQMLHVVCFMLSVAARYGNVRCSCRSFLFFSDALKQFASDDSAGINVTTENINEKDCFCVMGLGFKWCCLENSAQPSWSRHVGLERGTAELRTFSRGSSMRRPQARNGTWSDSWAVTRAEDESHFLLPRFLPAQVKQ